LGLLRVVKPLLRELDSFGLVYFPLLTFVAQLEFPGFRSDFRLFFLGFGFLGFYFRGFRFRLGLFSLGFGLELTFLITRCFWLSFGFRSLARGCRLLLPDLAIPGSWAELPLGPLLLLPLSNSLAV
jgi:hypothetical protein